MAKENLKPEAKPEPKLEPKAEPKAAVALLDLEFGRADLNLLRDKLNELIRRG